MDGRGHGYHWVPARSARCRGRLAYHETGHWDHGSEVTAGQNGARCWPDNLNIRSGGLRVPLFFALFQAIIGKEQYVPLRATASVSLSPRHAVHGKTAIEPVALRRARRQSLADGCASLTYSHDREGACSARRAQSRLGALSVPASIQTQLIVGIAASSVEDRRLSRKTGRADARVAPGFLAPPSYFKNPGDEGLFDWFARLLTGLGPLAEQRHPLLPISGQVTSVRPSRWR